MTQMASIRNAACAAMASLILLAAVPASPTTNRYGGPIYRGTPTAGLTAELYHVGGEAGGFSSIRALNALAGEATVTAEFAKLRGQYGDVAMDRFVKTFDFAINDAWKRAGEANVTFGAPAALSDNDLATGLISAGRSAGGTFWTGLFLDKLVTHGVHESVMQDIDARYGKPADAQYHRIANQLFYDLAQSLHLGDNLAPFH